MRIATWNVNSLKVRMPRVEEWLGYAQPDVLCLQETKMSDAAFPSMPFTALGYESAHNGEGRWNGVAILSRVGLDAVSAGFGRSSAGTVAGAGALGGTVAGAGALGGTVGGVGDRSGAGAGPEGHGTAAPAEARMLSADCGGVRVSSVYVPNGRSVGSEHYLAKLAWLAQLRAHLESTCDPQGAVAVCGDFNVAPEDRDVWNRASLEGATHVSEPERAALAQLLDWGLVDGFRARYDQDRLYSWWDYRAGDFHQHRGMRIDLLLLSRPLAEGISWALIDRFARKGKLPSDHAPVLVDLDPAVSLVHRKCGQVQQL
ncbi:MAG: exodeoxyribonuclease III, partial [Steroidobacteraceae bacterium]